MQKSKRSNEDHYRTHRQSASAEVLDGRAQRQSAREAAGVGSMLDDRQRTGAARHRLSSSLSSSPTAATAPMERSIIAAAHVIMQQPTRETILSSVAQDNYPQRVRLTGSTRRAGARDDEAACEPLQRRQRQKTPEAGSRWAHSIIERRARSLVSVALVGLYVLLTACALVARCAPTGNQRAKTSAGQHLGQGHRAPPQPLLSAAAAAPAPADKIGGDNLIGVDIIRPIILLNAYGPHDQRHAKFTSEQYNSQQQQLQQRAREEANISTKLSLETSQSTASLPARKQPPGDMNAAEDGGGHGDEDEQHILLVLSSDTAPSPSSLRRLFKRSGISDQRLAEIQMIRALKKQLERAATKIAADSTGDDDRDGGGGQTSTTGAEMAAA